MNVKRVIIQYHWEPGEGWWAESPDVEGFTAAGEDFAEVRRQALGGIDFALDEPYLVVEEAPILASDANQNPTVTDLRIPA